MEVGNFDGWLHEPAGLWTGYFWGERVYDYQTPQGNGYDDYAISFPALGASGTAHTFEIREVSRDAQWVTYRVYIDDQEVHTVLPNFGSGSVQSASNWIRKVAAGLETTDNTATVGVTRLNWVQYRDQNNNWYSWSPDGAKAQTDPADTFTWASNPLVGASAIYGTVIPSSPTNGVRLIDTFDDPVPRGRDDFTGWDEVVEGGGDIWVAYTQPDGYLHLDYTNPASYVSIRRKTGTYGRDLVTQVRFYDDLALQKGTSFGVLAIGGANYVILGVKTDVCPNQYFYRINGSLWCTGIGRSSAWHQFRFFVNAGGSYGEIDGIKLNGLGVNYALTPSTIDWIGVNATWGLTGYNYYNEPMLYYNVDY